MYDVVIIGSGLGGLECGVMLSREGYRVLVLEKNPVIGGCLQTFRRHGRTLDTGIHYIGGLDNGQILNLYFKYLGVMPALDVVRMDTDAFDTVTLGDREYGIGMGYDRFADNLKGYFPAEAADIDRFCSLLRKVGGTMSVEGLRRGLISDDAMQYMERSAFEAIDGMFTNPILKNVLTGTSLLYAGIKGKTSLYHYGMINHSFIESSYRFVGGSQQLADALSAQIRSNGGEVLTGTEVTAIKLQGDHVSGVEINGGDVAGGTFIEATNVISGIHPATTFDLVEKTSKIKKAYMTRLHTLENSCGVVTVYLLLKPGTVPYINRNYYIHSGDTCDTWQTEYDTARDTPRAVLFNMQATGHGQQFADVASILCPMNFDTFARWESTTVERRGAEYLDLKSHLTDRIVDFTLRRSPELREVIEHIYTTSPLTWRDYTATPQGSAYGIVKNCRSPFTTLIPINTRFENLLLTGQNINVHGALGVTVTAALTCSKLLGAEYIAKKIGNA
ncbi:MAG: NAD(P)/FAD-dependent oxidoreductase [Alistipes sp.]|jgi:phytoene dehydrogenase-like protein|nr:NAD(P)/FAD-dependent oxidoreductase [Alistipes sp.]